MGRIASIALIAREGDDQRLFLPASMGRIASIALIALIALGLVLYSLSVYWKQESVILTGYESQSDKTGTAAIALYQNGIPYRYEAALAIGNVSRCQDF